MAEKSKGPVIILIILLILSLGAAALGFIGLQNEKQTSSRLLQEKEDLQRSEKSAKKEIARLNEQIEELKTERDQRQARIQEYEAVIAKAKEDLDTEKTAKEEALSEIAKSKEELASLKSAKEAVESELKTVQSSLGELKGQLATIQKAKEEESKKAVSSKSKDQESKTQDVQLEKIVIASSDAAGPAGSQGASQAKALEGKVLVVNKDYDFVVVNLGQKDDINLADTLEVFRNDKKIGEMKIEEVRDAMSVATPSTKDIMRQIKEEDKVVRKAA